jgi:hypothetical protein
MGSRVFDPKWVLGRHTMQRRGRTVRVEPPFSVVEWIEMYKNNKFEVLGYKILGPGSDESWLYSKDQVPPKLAELRANLG